MLRYSGNEVSRQEMGYLGRYLGGRWGVHIYEVSRRR